MGGVAVLQPHDVLKQRVGYRQTSVQPMGSRRNYNFNPDANPNPKNNRRKRSPQKNRSDRSPSLSSSPPAINRHLVMGEVKILKRGEVLTSATASSKVDELKVVNEDLALSTTDRLGPEPDMVPKEIRISDFYAGSAFVSSPPPSSLPVPAFFKKRSVVTDSNDDATSDLRRLLRLDLSVA